ncbi:hypothetical protein SNK04_014158 [Fusarium graminearum]
MLRQDRDIWSCELIGVHPIRRQGADLRSATLDIHQLVADALWRHPATAEVGLRLDLVLGIRAMAESSVPRAVTAPPALSAISEPRAVRCVIAS